MLSNGLYPEQDHQNVNPDLGLNCLHSNWVDHEISLNLSCWMFSTDFSSSFFNKRKGVVNIFVRLGLVLG